MAPLIPVAGEVKNPSQVLPRSYLLGALIVIFVYLCANFAYLHVLSLPVMAREGYQRVAAKTMEILWGPRGAAFVSGLIFFFLERASLRKDRGQHSDRDR